MNSVNFVYFYPACFYCSLKQKNINQRFNFSSLKFKEIFSRNLMDVKTGLTFQRCRWRMSWMVFNILCFEYTDYVCYYFCSSSTSFQEKEKLICFTRRHFYNKYLFSYINKENIYKSARRSLIYDTDFFSLH